MVPLFEEHGETVAAAMHDRSSVDIDPVMPMERQKKQRQPPLHRQHWDSPRDMDVEQWLQVRPEESKHWQSPRSRIDFRYHTQQMT